MSRRWYLERPRSSEQEPICHNDPRSSETLAQCAPIGAPLTVELHTHTRTLYIRNTQRNDPEKNKSARNILRVGQILTISLHTGNCLATTVLGARLSHSSRSWIACFGELSKNGSSIVARNKSERLTVSVCGVWNGSEFGEQTLFLWKCEKSTNVFFFSAPIIILPFLLSFGVLCTMRFGWMLPKQLP